MVLKLCIYVEVISQSGSRYVNNEYFKPLSAFDVKISPRYPKEDKNGKKN